MFGRTEADWDARWGRTVGQIRSHLMTIYSEGLLRCAQPSAYSICMTSTRDSWHCCYESIQKSISSRH
jgi:hypothetical protein